MATGHYQRTEKQKELWKKNQLLGQGWNRGKTFKKMPKMIDKSCEYCGKIFKIGRDNGRFKFCSKDCKNEVNYTRISRKYYSDINYRKKVENWRLKARFGVTLNEYQKLLENQEYKCAICGILQSEIKRRFAVDHDHKTGKIRKLLCAPCNTGIGSLRDSTDLLEKAIKYLNNHAL